MKSAVKLSPTAMNIFLKQAALEDHWTTAYIGKALGLDGQTAKEVATQMALVGYVEAVPRKADTWRNTTSGNKLAGVRPARLTLAKAEDLLTDLEDRAAQFNMKDSPEGMRLQAVVALGSILTEHDPIQDIDIAVKLEKPKAAETAAHADELAAMKLLKGRSAALKLHRWNDTLGHIPARVVWKA